MDGTVLAWTWIPVNRRLPHEDGREIIEGEIISVNPPVILCRHGLHASMRVLDALRHATSGLVARVECSGDIVNDDTKLCCQHRKTLWILDATRVLHEFACSVAENTLRATGITDERCWNAIRTKRLWLAGEATNTDLDTARDAAAIPARDAARQRPRSVSWSVDAAWSAAGIVAWPAALDVAVAAMRDAGDDAAKDVVWTSQNTMLEQMIEEAHGTPCKNRQ